MTDPMRFVMVRCATHGDVAISPPMPGSGWCCPQCSDEQRQRERMNAEGLAPIRVQLDRIEALLHKLNIERIDPEAK